MKTTFLKRGVLFFCVVFLSSVLYLYHATDAPKKEKSLQDVRDKHLRFLENSPFKETLSLTKKARKKRGIPPNKYFEQMWELTINPMTGRTEPEKLYDVQKQLKSRNVKRAPGENNANAWEERGPNDVGGRTRAILFDPNDQTNRRVFAGGVSGGLWVNNDITSAASQWTRVQNVPGNLSVTSITVDPRNSNIWYVGTGEQYTAGDVVGTGVYRSNNGGNNWQAVNIPPAGGGDLQANPTNLFLSGIYYVNDIIAWENTTENRTELFVGVGAHIYGAASGPNNWLGIQSAGMYHSIDGGVTWNRIESANMRYQWSNNNYYYVPNDFEIGSDNRLWMGTINSPMGEGGGRVFSSVNGTAWVEAAASPLRDSNRVEIETSATDANKIYALTQGVLTDENNNVIEPVHIYRTTDGFATNPVATALPVDHDRAIPRIGYDGIPANDFTRGQAFYDLMIEADPTNDDIVYVGGIDLFRSANGGNNWTQISKWSNNSGLAQLRTPLVHADQHAMVFRPGNANQAIFGNDGGVYYASSLSTANNNANAIGKRVNNYNVTQYVKAGIGPNGARDQNGIFTAGSQDNGSQAFRNAVAGINGSEQLSGGDGFYTFVDKDGQYMTATYTNNNIYRFNLPWDGVGQEQGGGEEILREATGDFVNQMGYDSDANFILSNATVRANNVNHTSIKTIDVANNRNGNIDNQMLTAKPTAFVASTFANNTWYVGAADGKLFRLTNVGVGAANWAEINTPFVGSVSSVRLGATANDLLVTIHNYGVTSIWYSSDAGVNWVSKEGNLPDIPVRDILQNPLDRTEVIVATQLGVWMSNNFDNANPVWRQSYNGMSDVSVTSFDYWAIDGDDNNNIVIASTYGRGVFTGSFTANGVVDNESPTAPTNLVASNVQETSLELNWGASNDNVGVTAYDIYRDDVVVATVAATSETINGLTANTIYSFKVVARDAAGNTSADSNVINVRTQVVAADPCNGGAVLTAINGAFTDGSGNQDYPTNRNCSWLIRPENGGTVTLRFDAFNTEANYDFVTIYDGENTAAPQLGRFSGRTIPAAITSTGNAMYVQFTSDEIITASGWSARYEANDQGNNNEGCANGINVFPYSEGFEAGFGAWTQAAGDDFDWTHQQGRTFSNNTGPSSAQEGRFYVYVETSSPNNPNRTTILNSPCFDLRNQGTATFTFTYHMTGNAVGSLRLEASSDNGVTWASVWNQAGNQGNVWNNANVNLNAYAGNSVQLRFVGTSGNSWQGDMAVDNLRLATTANNNIATTEELGKELLADGVKKETIEVTVYPNPVQGGVLHIGGTGIENMNYKVMNLLGQVSKQGKLQTKAIDVQGLQNGVYILQLQTEGKTTIMRQFVKK
ncbi:T9SS type A sorting domain-containing protein [Aquimarina sp. TRL1]|uniref:CUB domain-containing protein n=1 Tax=Aquimarina sp. (strain TRL1) TaxID=2736252 RepID=UPI00158D3553|nr:CUB domain-containing protein [Aquimarina sp. TRL1]QKX03629.1 T9SS type A sorting domain-containing protein [Aquimarina sp. TRL1]